MRDGWVETYLGEIAEVIGGGTPSTSIAEYWDGDIVWLTPTEITSQDGKVVSDSARKITDLGFKNSGAQMLPRDSVVLTSRASVGYVALAGKDLCTNQGFQSLIPKQSVLAKFLMFWIQQNRAEFESRSAGSTFKEISKSNVKSIKLQLPSLLEQKRIVDLITSVDDYIESLQQKLGAAKKSRAAVLYELLAADGGNWVETTLGEVADVIDPHPSHRAPAVDDNGIPFIGIGDLRNTGDIDFAKARRVSRDILEEHKARYNRSDFLIGLGRVASIGMVVRLPDENTEYVVSPTLAVINAKDVLGQFLFYLLEGPHSQEQFQRFKKGSTRESVGMQILRKIKVHIPPLPEQKRIVDIIKSMDDMLNSTSCALSESKKLRMGLLSDLLSGKHEIPASYDQAIGAA
jgi:type I restriction enzyme S subunit